jgi:hypothetical protein
MPKIKNIKGFYEDKINYRFTVSLKDKHFTNKIIKKSFCYKDDYLHTKIQAEYYADKLAKYLLEMRSNNEAPLITYLNKIEVIDNRWS